MGEKNESTSRNNNNNKEEEEVAMEEGGSKTFFSDVGKSELKKRIWGKPRTK